MQKLVIEEFSGKIAQDKYVKESSQGLWTSEKKVIKHYFKQKSSILDIGCGTGRTTISLIKAGYKVTAIDIVPAMIKNAKKIAIKKKLKIRYQVGDATNLQFPNKSFDNVLFSFNGWEQIPGKRKREKALKEIFRILKPGGYFIFTTHNRQCNWNWVKQWVKYYILGKILKKRIQEIDYGDVFWERISKDGKKSTQFTHVSSIREVKKILKRVGFKIFNIQSATKLGDPKREYEYYFYICKKCN